VAIENLETKTDLTRFIQQRFFPAQKKPYMPWWEVGANQVDPRFLVPFATGWSNASYIATNFNTAAFYLDTEGFVHLKGGVEITDPSYSADILNRTIFTLPPDFRPALVNVNAIAAQEDNDGSGGGTASTALRGARVVVRPDGSVDLVMTASSAGIYVGRRIFTAWLDGTTFRVV
jgi:hypothetical protein